jgi:hypothetical protein
VAVATEVIAEAVRTIVVATVTVPGCRPIAERRFGPANDGEAANRFAGLLATRGAGDYLEDIGHRHALFCAGAAGRTDVFVECHAPIVAAFAKPVNSGAATDQCVSGRSTS